MANGITSPEPHLEHFHRRARATTVVHGLCWAMSSSIGQRCLWPQPLQWAATAAILRWSWRKASEQDQTRELIARTVPSRFEAETIAKVFAHFEVPWYKVEVSSG